MTNRRTFLAALLAGATLDPERLLWRAGAKHISIPRPAEFQWDWIGCAYRDVGGPFFHDTLVSVRHRAPKPGQYLALVRHPDDGEARIVGMFTVPRQDPEVPQCQAGPFSIAAAFGGILPAKYQLELVRSIGDRFELVRKDGRGTHVR